MEFAPGKQGHDGFSGPLEHEVRQHRHVRAGHGHRRAGPAGVTVGSVVVDVPRIASDGPTGLKGPVAPSDRKFEPSTGLLLRLESASVPATPQKSLPVSLEWVPRPFFRRRPLNPTQNTCQALGTHSGAVISPSLMRFFRKGLCRRLSSASLSRSASDTPVAPPGVKKGGYSMPGT